MYASVASACIRRTGPSACVCDAGNMGRTLTDEIVRGASDDALISMLTEVCDDPLWWPLFESNQLLV